MATSGLSEGKYHPKLDIEEPHRLKMSIYLAHFC